MYRTDHAHRWAPTDYRPMSSTYARTLWDDGGGMLMTGETRPADFGCTKDGDLVDVRRSGFPVDIDTDSIPLDQIEARIAPQRRPYIPDGCDQQGRHRSGVRAQTEAERAAEIRAAQRASAGMAWHASEPMPLRESAGDVARRIAAEVVGWGAVGVLIYAGLRLFGVGA